MAFGNRHCEPCRDHRPLAGRELVAVAGSEVEPGVARVRLRRNGGVGPQAADRELDHRVALVGSVESAIR